MRQHHRVTAVLLVSLFLWPDLASPLSAQNAPPTPQELDQLLSPIALYPDSLLSQIMTASSNPQEILDVDNWLSASPGLSGTALTDAAQQQGFDPAFIALVNFPQVLEMMAQHIDDYAAIGEAFTADQGAVTDSIQRLRAQAYAAGTLRSNAQQTVAVQQGPGQPIYVIQPANPQVVYVPQYDPTVVYAPPTGAMGAGPLIAFGAGITIGALLVSQPWGWGGWAWNWRARRVYYNNAAWGGWGRPYRPPHPWYRPRPINWSHRPGFGGNWHYRPPNYRPPRAGSRPGYARPPYNPGNRPGYRPGPNRPVPLPRPGASRPNPAPPRANPNRPRTNPNAPRANPNAARPTPHPAQPSRPQGRPPGGRPPAQAPSKPTPRHGGNPPAHQSRPAPPQNHRQKPPSKSAAEHEARRH
jgi:Protein of unknown function (DUF3300)